MKVAVNSKNINKLPPKTRVCKVSIQHHVMAGSGGEATSTASTLVRLNPSGNNKVAFAVKPPKPPPNCPLSWSQCLA
jgi:hypothetical protein